MKRSSIIRCEIDGLAHLGNDAMILAEGGNLLLTRMPSGDKKAAWESHSKKVRELGQQLYLSAKKKEGARSDRTYRAMLKNVEVIRLEEPAEIFPAYVKARHRDDGRSTILVEYGDFYNEK